MAREHLKRRIVAAGDRITVDYLVTKIERGEARVVDLPKASQTRALFCTAGGGCPVGCMDMPRSGRIDSITHT